MRLQLTFDGGAQLHEGRVILHALPRIRTRKTREAFKHGKLPSQIRSQMSPAAAAQVDALRRQGPHPDTVAEVKHLLSDSGATSREDALDHLAFHLSARARRELVSFGRAAQGMSGSARAALGEAATRDLLKRLLAGGGR